MRRHPVVVIAVFILVDQDGEQLLPDLIASLVVRRTGVWCFERLGPVGGTDPDVGPVGLDQQALGGGSSYNLTAGSIADTMSADDFRRAISGSVSSAAAAPSVTRSRRVQVCTPSSPRLGSTSAI
jgi:hypothetical protein